MPKFRPRLISAVLALVSIGLFASLLPQTSFVPKSSGELADAIGPLWPDYSVEQPLDGVPDVISEVRIWARAGLNRGEAPIAASLLRADSGEPVRQVKSRILPSKLFAPYVLAFPPYRPAPGEKLVLQFWISTDRENSVMFGTSEPGEDAASPTLNRQPTNQGPLAYEFIWTGAGWRAALAGSIPDLARLAGAIAAAAIAAAMTIAPPPFISRTMRKTVRKVRTAFLTLTGPVHRTLKRAQLSQRAKSLRAEAPSRRRGFYIFPWLIPIFAILHYLASNLLIFRVSESIVLGLIAMAIVTILFLAFRLIFKSVAVAAALTGLLGIAFFSYGHIHMALGDHADDKYFLGLGAPLIVGLAAVVSLRPDLVRNMGLMLNVGSVVLVVLPAYQIALDFHAGSSPAALELHERFPGLDARLAEANESLSRNELRDIYYIILDEYPRSGSPPEFDNSEFVQELENRGFYVASQARSNYVWTRYSVTSSLNMQYVDEEYFNPGHGERQRLVAKADDHILGRILTTIGYRYVHVSSGTRWTETSRNADIVVDFSPSGRMLSGAQTRDPFSLERATRLSRRFTNTFLRTTAAMPFLSSKFGVSYDDPYAYSWTHPFRTLAWLDFMKEAGTIQGPKFVFAHLIKPHEPASFDRHGNTTLFREGWSNDHDPTVSSAFYGQVIWLNDRMLEVVDAILDSYEEPPIILIAGDHGDRDVPELSEHFDILAAFLLPDGGDSALYPSITSVNHFRAILDYYFELDLGLLEDR